MTDPQPIVHFEGIPYRMDRHAVRVALVKRKVEGKFLARAELAEAMGCSRSTASRCLSGRGVNMTLTLKALAELGLTFNEVFTRCEDQATADET